MKSEYLMLKSLRENGGYDLLKELWMIQLSKIEEGRDRAAAKGNESAWRYWAGQEKGFKIAITQLERALTDMEKKDEDGLNQESVNQLLEDLKIKGDLPQ